MTSSENTKKEDLSPGVEPAQQENSPTGEDTGSEIPPSNASSNSSQQPDPVTLGNDVPVTDAEQLGGSAVIPGTDLAPNDDKNSENVLSELVVQTDQLSKLSREQLQKSEEELRQREEQFEQDKKKAEEELQQREQQVRQREEQFEQDKKKAEEELQQREQQVRQREEQFEQDEKKAESQPEEVEAIIQRICAEDTIEFEEETKEFNRYWQQINDVSTHIQTLWTGMSSVRNKFNQELLPSCESAREDLPEELKTQLENRHQTIKLIQKMLERRIPELEAEASSIDQPTDPKPLPRLEPETLNPLQTPNSSSEVFQQKADQAREKIKDERYRLVFDLRTQADEVKKRLLSLVKRKVLDILDGLHSGELNSHPLIEQLKGQADVDKVKEKLDQWFNLHSQLQDEIHGLLAQMSIHPMAVNKGDDADYDALTTEQVKEVVQRGYEYIAEPEAPQVLRLAQVIMVKNN
jgi:hypothetical protein